MSKILYETRLYRDPKRLEHQNKILETILTEKTTKTIEINEKIKESIKSLISHLERPSIRNYDYFKPIIEDLNKIDKNGDIDINKLNTILGSVLEKITELLTVKNDNLESKFTIVDGILINDLEQIQSSNGNLLELLNKHEIASPEKNIKTLFDDLVLKEAVSKNLEYNIKQIERAISKKETYQSENKKINNSILNKKEELSMNLDLNTKALKSITSNLDDLPEKDETDATVNNDLQNVSSIKQKFDHIKHVISKPFINIIRSFRSNKQKIKTITITKEKYRKSDIDELKSVNSKYNNLFKELFNSSPINDGLETTNLKIDDIKVKLELIQSHLKESNNRKIKITSINEGEYKNQIIEKLDLLKNYYGRFPGLVEKLQFTFYQRAKTNRESSINDREMGYILTSIQAEKTKLENDPDKNKYEAFTKTIEPIHKDLLELQKKMQISKSVEVYSNTLRKQNDNLKSIETYYKDILTKKTVELVKAYSENVKNLEKIKAFYLRELTEEKRKAKVYEEEFKKELAKMKIDENDFIEEAQALVIENHFELQSEKGEEIKTPLFSYDWLKNNNKDLFIIFKNQNKSEIADNKANLYKEWKSREGNQYKTLSEFKKDSWYKIVKNKDLLAQKWLENNGNKFTETKKEFDLFKKEFDKITKKKYQHALVLNRLKTNMTNNLPKQNIDKNFAFTCIQSVYNKSKSELSDSSLINNNFLTPQIERTKKTADNQDTKKFYLYIQKEPKNLKTIHNKVN